MTKSIMVCLRVTHAKIKKLMRKTNDSFWMCRTVLEVKARHKLNIIVNSALDSAKHDYRFLKGNYFGYKEYIKDYPQNLFQAGFRKSKEERKKIKYIFDNLRKGIR